MEPKLKRKKGSYQRRHSDPLPVSSTSTPQSIHPNVGHFNGVSVEIFKSDDIAAIYQNGCFGISSFTKAAPTTLWKNKKPTRVTQSLFDKKIEWQNQFVNEIIDKDSPVIEVEIVAEPIQDPIDVRPIAEDDTVADPEIPKTIVPDPFPLAESLVLFMEEALFLHFTLKCLTIVDLNGQLMATHALTQKFMSMNPHFVRNFVVYQYFRAKNWIVKSGLKFGGDFLLYKQGPRHYHASFVVVIKDVNDDSTTNSINYLHGLYRTAENAKKDLLVVEVYYPETIDLTTPSWLESLSLFKVSEYTPRRFTISQKRK